MKAEMMMMRMRMKRVVPVWWSSPKSLLHSIIQFTIPSFLIAFFIIKYGRPLESIHGAVQKPNMVLHTSSSSLARKATLISSPSIRRGTASGPGGHQATTTSSLGAQITDWDQQRQIWFSQNDSPPTRLHQYANGRLQPSILLVTGSSPKPCRNPLGNHLLLQFSKNKMDYCRLHGIRIFYNMALLDGEMADCWSKLPLLRKLMLSHPEVDWIWWMDSDAAFTDMTFELPMEKYEQYNLVLHGWGEEVYNKKSWIGLNAGVFLIRNCQWSLDFMDVWAAFGENQKVRDELGSVLSQFLTKRPVFESDDQAALVYILNTQKEIWEKKVFLENSYCLHGYWEIIVDRYEKLMESSHAGYGDDRWPFVTHFVGCKPCGEQEIEGRCMKQMQRAFNFADNQVLQHYGYEHKHLGTSEVVRVANKSMDRQQQMNPLKDRS
ncbi:hypothetical protein GOP47_0006707 [Adiantum capillus-veneris]|uniref:Uncharacterized protein n=1 Tax=Adiantum capillus-veneris TaxID=13818 RepID=A0A9D4V3E0_ADICA|nr:hypothetical protein GOP47_0006707 [Adiantum capillus-veneris]